MPEKLKQEAKTKQDEEFNCRGTLMAAVCEGDKDMTLSRFTLCQRLCKISNGQRSLCRRGVIRRGER